MIAAMRHGVGPWILPVVVVLELIFVVSGRLDIGVAVGVAAAVEVLLVLTAVGRARAAVRSVRGALATGCDFWLASEDGLAQLMPRRLAHLILIEVRLWTALGRRLTARHGGQEGTAFGYHHGMAPLIWVIVALVAVEGAVVELVLLIALPHTPWPWISLALHAYSLIWVIGLLAAMTTRPHLLAGDELRLRDGVFAEIVIPVAAIRGARPTRHPNLGRSGFTVDDEHQTATLAHADATVALSLDPLQRITVNGATYDGPLTTMRITVDNPDRLVAALRNRTAPRT